MHFNVGSRGSSFFSVTYKLELPPGYSHKNKNLFVRKLQEQIAFNSSPAIMCYAFPSFASISLQSDTQVCF